MSKQVWSENNAIEIKTLDDIASRILEARGYSTKDKSAEGYGLQTVSCFGST